MKQEQAYWAAVAAAERRESERKLLTCPKCGREHVRGDRNVYGMVRCLTPGCGQAWEGFDG